MLVFYLTVPFMVLAIAIAVVPLLWTMQRQHYQGEKPLPATSSRNTRDERIAA